MLIKKRWRVPALPRPLPRKAHQTRARLTPTATCCRGCRRYPPPLSIHTNANSANERHHPPGARASRPHPYSCKEPPVHGHSLAKRTKPAFTGFSSLVPSLVRAGRPRSRGSCAGAQRRPRSLGVLCGRDARVPGHSLAKAPNPVLFPRAKSCAGGTPAFPGGLVRAGRPRSRGGPFDRLHCLHRLIREGCQRNERCEKSLQCTSSAMEADGLFVHQQRSDASLIPGIHTNGKLCFWNESPTLTAYLGWSSPGSAGVSPASLFLQTASRPRPLPRKAHQTRLYGVLFLCRDARVPGGSCAGGTPAFPGGLVRAGRPRSRGGPFDRLHCLHRLIREGCQRNERCEKSLQCTSSAMEADGLFVHQQRSDASLIPGIHTNGKLCFWNAYIDRLPWLVIPRERGRPARILIPAKSLSTATPSQSAPLRGSLPS